MTDIICANDENANECDLFFKASLEAMQMSTFYLQVEDCKNIVEPIVLEE